MVKRNEVKEFCDIYLDGSKDCYYMTYGELVDTFGEELGNIIWKTGEVPSEYYE